MSKYKYAPYSFSKLDLFQRCPLAWKFHYIDRIPEAKSPALIVGDLVHRMIKEYLSALQTKREASNHAIVDELLPKYVRLSGQYADEFQQYLSGIRSITLPPVEKVAIEAEVAVDTDWKAVSYDSEDTLIRGRIDLAYRIEDVLVIRDWKTNRYIPSEQVIEKDKQTRLYALLCSAFPDAADVTEFTIELYYLRYGGTIRRARLSPDELEETKEWVLGLIEAIESEQHWEPTPGEHCEWCSYVNICDAVKKAVKVESATLPAVITSPQQAVEMARLYKVLGVVRNRLGELLKAWVEAHGPVEIAGETLDFYSVDVVRWNTAAQKAQLAKVLLDAGIERNQIWDVFSTSKSAVCSLLKKHGLTDHLEEALSTGEKSTMTRFDFRKTG